MLFTDTINKTIKLASHLHRHQVRNDLQKTPYSSHLVSVAMLVESVTSDEDIIVAALMHDSLEDVPGYTYEQLVNDCGERVAQIVLGVTEPLDANKSLHEQLPWLTRKEMYLDKLRNGTIESILVACADKIHNIESFLIDYKAEGEAFNAKFGSSIRNRIWFHEQVLEIVEQKLEKNNPLRIRFTQAVNRYSAL